MLKCHGIFWGKKQQQTSCSLTNSVNYCALEVFLDGLYHRTEPGLLYPPDSSLHAPLSELLLTVAPH